MKKERYEVPAVEVLDVMVEQGFADSGSDGNGGSGGGEDLGGGTDGDEW